MAARPAVWCFLVGGLAPGAAIRTHSKAKLNRTEAQVQDQFDQCGLRAAAVAQVGQPGMVDFIYSWGAPGIGSPRLQNTRTEDPCFPGLRAYHTSGVLGWFGGIWTDLAAYTTNAAYYAHASMEAAEFNVETREMTLHACNDDNAWRPWTTAWGSVPLHSSELYAQTTQRADCPIWSNLSKLANQKAYMQDPRRAAEEAKPYGWRLVSFATHDGSGTQAAGPQVSHLFQNPETMECALTFMGTDSWRDWVSNLAVSATKFCGLTYEDEYCPYAGLGRCRVRKPRGAFTHWGLTDRLRKIVRTAAWEYYIQPALPHCSKLYTMGHSAGGAQAELFSACVANAPQPGEFGYEEDYKWMGFVKKEAKRLKYL